MEFTARYRRTLLGLGLLLSAMPIQASVLFERAEARNPDDRNLLYLEDH
jgi:hypothetical protein